MADFIESRSIGLAAAQRVLDAAVADAASKGQAMCLAIADPSGLPVLTARMDGAPRLSAQIAQDKAYSVASFGGLPTDAWWDVIKDEPALVHGLTQTDRLTIFGGGLPLLADGQLVGAIGVSGGSAEEDRQVAAAGAAAL